MEKEKIYYTAQFKKIAGEQKVLLNRGTSEYGVTYVQSLVLLYLSNMRETLGNDYEVSQKNIEDYMSLKGSTITHILGRLEESGMIMRMRSEKDCRTNHIHLTEKGEKFIPIFFKVLDNVEALMTKGMKEAEKKQLEELLKKVLENMKD